MESTYQQVDNKREKKTIYKGRSNKLTILVLVLLILSLIGGIYLYRQYVVTKDEVEILKDPERYAAILADEEQQILDKIGKHILLPDEEPTLYSILDVEMAKKSYGDFFENAKDGDRLVIYSKKAIIYREEIDLVINAGPIMYLPLDSDTN
ncbi:hypothetical protein KJ918_00245 [Patescibacteria group bacterium]|nr:hypothetical protein [Patescibacteria group bacterium]